MVDDVLGVASIGCETIVAVPSFILAIVEANGITAPNAVYTLATTLVCLDSNPVAHLELSYAWANFNDFPAVFVAGNEVAVVQVEMPARTDNFGIGAANRAGVYF